MFNIKKELLLGFLFVENTKNQSQSMLRKLRKTLSKEFARSYEKIESNYLGLENRIYATIETRISNLEAKFDELSELIKEEMRQRIERNEDKIDENEAHDDGTMFSESVEDVKEALEADLNEVKENVTEQVEQLSKKAQKAKEVLLETVASKLGSKKVKEQVENIAQDIVEETKEKAEKAKDYLDKKVKNKKVKKKTEEIVEEITETTESVADAIADKVQAVVEDAKNLVSKEKKKASKKIKDVAEKLPSQEVKEDDLTLLMGMGKKIAAKLKAEGIISLQQLAELSKAELEEIDIKIRSFDARYHRYNWKEQAQNHLTKKK